MKQWYFWVVFLYLRIVMGNDIFMRLFDVLGAFWCTWRLLDVFWAFWCTWRLFIAYSRQRSQCFGDFYRDFSMKSLFSRFVSVVLAGEGAIRTGNFSSNLCFPGSFLWFQLAKGRFVPGIFHQIFVFPVLFFGFRRGRGDSYRDFFIKSLFSRFFSLVSAGEGAIRTGIWLWNSSFPGLFRWFHTFTFTIFYKLMFYHILHKLIN